MIKLILIIFTAILLSSCTLNTKKEDPYLKESERIAVLEKVKTDTTVVFITIDNKYYLVEKNKITVIDNGSEEPLALVIGFLLGVLLILLIWSKVDQ